MRRNISKIVEFLAYWVGLDAVFYWLNRKAKRIVTFHNVIPDNILRNEDRGGICFGAEAFREAVRIMKRHFKINVDFEDPESLIITFDDGYANQYEVAAEILRQEGNLPAVIFVAGSLISSKGFENALIVDRMEQWSKGVPIDIAERAFGRKFSSRDQLWSEGVLPLFAADRANKGAKAFQKLHAAYSVDQVLASRDSEFIRLRFDGITKMQIDHLRRLGWKVGYHTYSHFPLSKLSDEEAYKELVPIDNEMRNVPFAYPYGNIDFVSERDENIVAKLDYPSGYSCDANIHPRHGKYFLRRMMPPIDKYRLNFELCGLRHFLKYRRLLPTNNE